MKISRQVGTASQILNVYAQDFSVTTGAGIINIPATTVSYTWFRNNHSGASTGVGVSTASMGTYTSGAWTQINSTVAAGWYQFCIPNDALLSGDCSALYLRVSTGAFNMAAIPIEIELTKTNNQAYMSSQTVGFVQNGVNVTSIVGTAAVTSAGGQLTVSTQAIDKGGYGITTLAANSLNFGVISSDVYPLFGVIDAATVGNINTTSFTGSTAVLQALSSTYPSSTLIGADLYIYNVTTGAGQRRQVVNSVSTNAIVSVDQWLITPTQSTAKYVLFARAPNSTSYIPGVDWSNVIGKTAFNNLSSTFISTNQAVSGGASAGAIAAAVWDEITTNHAVSSTFGILTKNMAVNVSTIMSGVNVTSFSSAITTNANLLQIYGSAAVTSASGQLRVSTQAIDKGGYGVTSIAAYGTALVTSAAGILNVSTQAVDPGAVWNAYTSTYSTGGTFGGSIIISSDAVSSSQIIQGIWNELYTAYTSVSSSFGLALYTAQSASGLTSTVVGDAVWSRINSSYSGVSTFGYLAKQITSVSAGVNVTAFSGTITTNANVIQSYGSAIVTSASGQFRVSTQAIDKGGYGVTSISAAVTTTANVVQVLGGAAAGVSGYLGVDWGNVTNKAAYNDLSSTFISTNQSIAGASAPTAAQVAVAVWSEINSSYSGISTFGYVVKQVTSITASGSVNVSSIAGSPVVTTSAGVLLVSTQTIPTFATSSDARFAFLDVSVSSRTSSSDSRFGNLDGSISSRAASSDARFARLDISVSSRASAGDAMALTSAERATLAGVVLTTTQSEGFRSVNSAGSLMQLQYEILANLTEFSNSGTTRTLNSVTSHTGGVATYQYNSTTPSAITRTA